MQTEFYEGLNTKFVDTVKQNASSDDVINFIVKEVNKHSKEPFAKMVVKALSYGKPSRDVFIKRLFDYVCHSVNYLRDPYGKEIIFTPKLLVNRGKGDCKKQSLFIATILKAAGIEPTLKVVSYKGTDWEHIFVTARGEDGQQIILDPVNDKQFNKEVDHKINREYFLNGTKSKIMPNQLQSMGKKEYKEHSSVRNFIGKPSNEILTYANNAFGSENSLACNCNLSDKQMDEFIGSVEDYIGAKHRLKDLANKVKDKIKTVMKVAKKAGFALPRAAFLGILKLGQALEKTPIKLHLGAKLAELWAKDASTIKKMWSDFGGNPDILGKTILESTKTTINGKAHEFVAFDSLQEGLDTKGIHGMGQAAAVAGAITAAMPLILAAKKLLVTAKIITPQQANSIDAVIEDATGKHDASGIPDVDAKGNEIISSGASQGDNGHSGGNVSTKKGCFLTTACVEYYGLADNCYELTTLRNFRDNFLIKKHSKDVKLYYELAPILVDKLKADKEKNNQFAMIFTDIKMACLYIEKGEFNLARMLYSDTVKRLINRYNLK